MSDIHKDVVFQCPWCPCFFLNIDDLQNHQDAKCFRVAGGKPCEYDHRIQWKNMLEYRDKREPYDNDNGGYLG